MPEGIEIRKFADIIRHNVEGHMITKINILKGRYTKKPFDGLQDLEKHLPVKVINVKTKGKFTYIELMSCQKENTKEDVKKNVHKNVIEDGKTFWLFNTLGLTGGWTVCGKTKNNLADVHNSRYLKSDKHEGLVFAYPIIWEYISNNNLSEWFERALDHLNVEFIMDNGLRLYFYDQLSFGTLKIIESKADLEKKLKELGADIMDEETTFEVFKNQITKKVNCKKMIGNVIVNQRIISGVGNYLRADALWMSKISPFRLVETISDKELELLYKSLRALMWGDYDYDFALKKGYINKGFKIPHDYGREFFIYRQETDLDGNKVSKKELFEGSQKRFIFWVENVQK
jgi:formamidopyrimidine-DNA glycosylase